MVEGAGLAALLVWGLGGCYMRVPYILGIFICLKLSVIKCLKKKAEEIEMLGGSLTLLIHTPFGGILFSTCKHIFPGLKHPLYHPSFAGRTLSRILYLSIHFMSMLLLPFVCVLKQYKPIGKLV